MTNIKINFENIITTKNFNFNDFDALKESFSYFFNLPQESKFQLEWEKIKPILKEKLPIVDTFIQLGIGGSSLGSETLVNALGEIHNKKFYFLDNIDPDYIMPILNSIDPNKTLFYVVTKSGTTMETISQFIFIYNWLLKKLDNPQKVKNHFVFCTDPNKGDLKELANLWNIPCFEIPENLGGRFSVLSAVGLFPALMSGIDPFKLLEGANLVREDFLNSCKEGKIHKLIILANEIITHYQKHNRRITVFMPYSQKLKTLSFWFTQLWAESLGKNNLGLTPLPAVGPTDQHSILQLLCDGPDDKVIGLIKIEGFNNVLDLNWNGPKLNSFELLSGITLNQLLDSEEYATKQVLLSKGRPLFEILLPRLNETTLGELLFSLELLTAITGYLLKINPYDQPGVEEGKILTKKRIIAAKQNMN
jgi:glucose-6-phosphate isomerase